MVPPKRVTPKLSPQPALNPRIRTGRSLPEISDFARHELNPELPSHLRRARPLVLPPVNKVRVKEEEIAEDAAVESFVSLFRNVESGNHAASSDLAYEGWKRKRLSSREREDDFGLFFPEPEDFFREADERLDRAREELLKGPVFDEGLKIVKSESDVEENAFTSLKFPSRPSKAVTNPPRRSEPSFTKGATIIISSSDSDDESTIGFESRSTSAPQLKLRALAKRQAATSGLESTVEKNLQGPSQAASMMASPPDSSHTSKEPDFAPDSMKRKRTNTRPSQGPFLVSSSSSDDGGRVRVPTRKRRVTTSAIEDEKGERVGMGRAPVMKKVSNEEVRMSVEEEEVSLIRERGSVDREESLAADGLMLLARGRQNPYTPQDFGVAPSKSDAAPTISGGRSSLVPYASDDEDT